MYIYNKFIFTNLSLMHTFALKNYILELSGIISRGLAMSIQHLELKSNILYAQIFFIFSFMPLCKYNTSFIRNS